MQLDRVLNSCAQYIWCESYVQAEWQLKEEWHNIHLLYRCLSQVATQSLFSASAC